MDHRKLIALIAALIVAVNAGLGAVLKLYQQGGGQPGPALYILILLTTSLPLVAAAVAGLNTPLPGGDGK